MNKSICFYFQVHQPWRLSKLNIIEASGNKDLFVGMKNSENENIFKKVADKSYLPATKLLHRLAVRNPDFKMSFSLSGTFVEQAQKFNKSVLTSFKKLINTGQVELLNETYYHSLAWVASRNEFVRQIELHRSMIWQVFKRRPTIFRNTELIYENELASFINKIGFQGILAEGWEGSIGAVNPNYVYKPELPKLSKENKTIVDESKLKLQASSSIKLLLRNYKLSDDIAFRFSDKNSSNYPLTAEKFVEWINISEGNTINLFMDFETFGEHQWEETGIFKFLSEFVNLAIKSGIKFKTPSETIKMYRAKSEISFQKLTSWADEARDLSAWTGNAIQDSALKALYEIEVKIQKITKGNKNREEKDLLLEIWRRLQTSDHFYYMCTKYWNDGDVHKYFSPYDSPYNAYINFMNCLNDLIIRIERFEM